MPRRWLAACWSGGHFLGRPTGVLQSPHDARQAAGDWLRSPEGRERLAWLNAPEIRLQPIVTALLLRTSSTAIHHETTGFLAKAFAVLPLNAERLKWHGVALRFFADQSNKSQSERLAAFGRYLANSGGLSAHERIALAAAARAAGLGPLVPTRAAPLQTGTGETADGRARDRDFGRVAAFAMAMLDDVSGSDAHGAWLTLDEVARMLKVERSVVDELVEDGLLGHVAIRLRGETIVRVLPRHLDELARNFCGRRSCRDGADPRSRLEPSSSSARAVGTGMSSGTTPSRAAVADGPPAPSIAPKLKRPGKGYAPVGPKRPTRKRGQKAVAAKA